jgi:hypothetical protein
MNWKRLLKLALQVAMLIVEAWSSAKRSKPKKKI